MVTSVSKKAPATPARAARRRSAVDRQLDVDLFKALGDPTRAKLLACLMKCRRPCSVGEVAECCDVDFSVVARHLALLARAGIVSGDKRGRTVWYVARCADVSQRLRALADAIDECCPLVASAEIHDGTVVGAGCGDACSCRPKGAASPRRRR